MWCDDNINTTKFFSMIRLNFQTDSHIPVRLFAPLRSEQNNRRLMITEPLRAKNGFTSFENNKIDLWWIRYSRDLKDQITQW